MDKYKIILIIIGVIIISIITISIYSVFMRKKDSLTINVKNSDNINKILFVATNPDKKIFKLLTIKNGENYTILDFKKRFTMYSISVFNKNDEIIRNFETNVSTAYTNELDDFNKDVNIYYNKKMLTFKELFNKNF